MAIGKGLGSNTALQSLGLEWNNISWESETALREALGSNTKLRL